MSGAKKFIATNNRSKNPQKCGFFILCVGRRISDRMILPGARCVSGRVTALQMGFEVVRIQLFSGRLGDQLRR